LYQDSHLFFYIEPEIWKVLKFQIDNKNIKMETYYSNK